MFHFLEIEAVDGSEALYDTDKLNEFIREAAALVPTLHKSMLDIDVDDLMKSKYGNPKVDINLLKVSDLQSLLKHCRRIHNNLTLQMEQNGVDGFDILTLQ